MSKRKKVVELQEVSTSKPSVIEHKITFAAWFENSKKKYKLREHQDYALQVFFEKHGLGQIETPDRYDELFMKF